MKISIIQPSRNNLKYLKWSYAAIRKNQGDHEVQICIADDASTDGTREWLEEISVDDPNLSFIVNDSGNRVGHTILYDRLVNEVAEHDVCMIFHADMYLAEGALDSIEYALYDLETTKEDTHKHLKVVERYKTIVSLTRIEPPLHPPGPEKIVKNFGTEPEQFLPTEFDSWVQWYLQNNDKSKTTEGIFAPWAFFKRDFQEIGGHDPLYAPQSKEDSDIFNRFHLNGCKFIQVWDGFVYHMTCRGSRFNPTLTSIGKNSDEWNAQNMRSSRNFIRKWGHFVKHDRFMKPIVPPKYDVGLVVHNCNSKLLAALEPWCSDIYVDMDDDMVYVYTNREQKNTTIDLESKIHYMKDPITNDVVVVIDGNLISEADANYIQMLSEILADSGEAGQQMGIGNLRITINKLDTYENDLIVCEENKIKELV
jgi:glycosyltransferase involved in cell wall biosynthesis